MLSRRRMIQLGGLPLLLGVLYLEEWFYYWFPNLSPFVFILTASIGAIAWSWTLPHPRQERKRREALEKLQKEVARTEETLAEKRP